MKFLKSIRLLFIYKLITLIVFAATSDIIYRIQSDQDACYYWTAIHNSQFFEIESDELQNLIGELNNADLATESTHSSFRHRAVTLLAARVNQVNLPTGILTSWISELSGASSAGTEENNLIHEITMTLGAQEKNGRNELQSLLNSESRSIREAALSALLFYASEDNLDTIHTDLSKREDAVKVMADEVVQAYQQDAVRGAELAEALAKKSEFAPHATQAFKHYLAYQTYDLTDQEWLEFIGENRLIDIRSTSEDFYNLDTGYLSESLTNKFFISKINEILSSKDSSLSRPELEQIFRHSIVESSAVSKGYNTLLFYLLGFELTAEEEAFLVNQSGLSKDSFLPRGVIHLIGYNGDFLIATIDQSDANLSSIDSAELARPATAKAKPNNEQTEMPPHAPKESSNWWLWLIGLLVVAGGILVVARRKS